MGKFLRPFKSRGLSDQALTRNELYFFSQRAISDLLRTIESTPDLVQIMESVRNESSHSKTKPDYIVNGQSSMDWQ